MPPGDAQRVWFEEMLRDLRAWWKPGTSWDDFIEFCHRMMDKRTAIRAERGIKSPMMYCPICQGRRPSEAPGIGIRSGLFALMKIGLITQDEFAELDRSWKHYRRDNGLTAYGDRKGEVATAHSGHA